MKLLKKLVDINKTDKLRIKENLYEVNNYNKTMAIGALRICSIVLILPLIVSPFFKHWVIRIIVCLVSLVIFLAMIAFFKKGRFDKQPLIGLYITLSTAFILTILLSVAASPDERATILLGTFCFIPIIYIDYFNKKLIFMLSFLILHTVLAFNIKGTSLAFEDLLNSVCLLCLGASIGHIMQQTKLTSFELKKKLIFERETDILTGLKNRRKMFELFGLAKKNRIAKPTGAVLLDIDFFKQYNDIYGHTAGDELLRVLGQTLLVFENEYPIKFYRYGGEEFSAFIWDYSPSQQKILLEQIRIAVENMEIEHGVTVSIGYMIVKDQQDINLEAALTLADIALYDAKNNGRNKVVLHKSSYED